MSQTMNYAQTIAAQDLAFRQSLAASAIDHMQTIAGRSFTPAEIQTTKNELMGNNIQPQYSSQQLQSNAASPTYNPNYYNKTKQDDLNQLNPYGTSTPQYSNSNNGGLYIG